jgi:AmmeMemoRadiSam system protein A
MHYHPAPLSDDRSSLSLTDDERRYLLALARTAIAEAITTAPGAKEGQQQVAEPFPELSKITAGVFVSLHISDALRGCIGYLEGMQPLPPAVQDTARAAALRDPRFEPVREDELKEIDIEISVLSPLEQIFEPKEISIGSDGLMVRSGKQQGVLLPQVAIRAGFDARAFLEHTCLKAGLPKDAWKLPHTEIFRFKAEVFGEKATSIPSNTPPEKI